MKEKHLTGGLKILKYFSKIIQTAQAIIIISSILILTFQSQYEINAHASEIGVIEDELIFSHEAGFYDDEIELVLISEKGYKIYYTTDGSIPDPLDMEFTKIYYNTIELKDRSRMPPSLSRDLIVEMQFNREYRPPLRVRQGNVIRAVSVSPEGISSRVFTNSYFIGILKDSDKNMGVISLSGDPKDLFDKDEGIYYKLDNNDYRELINVEYFTTEKDRIFSFDAETRVFGGFTRNFAQKSLKLIFTDGMEKDVVKYPVFGDFSRDIYGETIDSFGRLRLHTGGNDSKHTTFLDGMIMELSQEMNLAINPYIPVITFINGEYWGLYGLREDYKSNFFESRFHIDYNNVVAIKIVWGCENVPDITSGTPEDIRYYQEMYSFLENYDFKSDVAYKHFIDYYIDVDSLIDFYIANLYVNNIDWPGNNVRMWRTRETEEGNPYADTRWRFILHDVDAGFKDTSREMLDVLMRDEKSLRPSAPPYDYWATLMFRKMAQNEEFVEKFTDRVLFHINSTYEKQHVLNTIQKYSEIQQPSVTEHKARWNHLEAYPYVNALSTIKNFVNGRDIQFLNTVSGNFNQGEIQKVELSGFNKIESAYLYFGDTPMNLTLKEADFEVYSFEGKSLKIKDYSESIKGYILYTDGKFSYRKGNDLVLETGNTKTKIIPVTFSIRDFIASAEGVIFIFLTGFLVFLISLGLTRRKIKNDEKW